MRTGHLLILAIVSFGGLRGSSGQIPAKSPAVSEQTVKSAGPPAESAGAISSQTIGELERIRQAALESDYAYRQVAHLTNNIGPRLSGSAQAAKAVEYVAGELKKLGCEVTLEKVMVPHWVRGEESAALVQYPGQAEHTVQKIVLCALGPSVATPADGLTADLVVANSFDEFKTLQHDQIAGRIEAGIKASSFERAAKKKSGGEQQH